MSSLLLFNQATDAIGVPRRKAAKIRQSFTSAAIRQVPHVAARQRAETV
jgi:hypothetical protein